MEQIFVCLFRGPGQFVGQNNVGRTKKSPFKTIEKKVMMSCPNDQVPQALGWAGFMAWGWG